MKEAHGIVVTDVAFVPESKHGRELLAGNEAALLSVAVDSRCKLHLLPARRMCVGLWGRATPQDPTLTRPPLPTRVAAHLAAAAAVRSAHRG